VLLKTPLLRILKKRIKRWLLNGILIKILTTNKKLPRNLDKSQKLMKFSLMILKEKLMILTDLMLLNMELVSISIMLMISLNTFLKTLGSIIMKMLTSLEVFLVEKEENLV